MVSLGRRSRDFYVSHGCYTVTDNGGGIPLADAAPWEELIHPGLEGSGGALIVTGTFSGTVEVQVEILDDRADPEDTGIWEQIEERELTAFGDTVLVAEMDGSDRGFDVLEVSAGESYQLRVHARGRDASRGYVTGPQPPIEQHLVQLWPTRQTPSAQF